MGLAFRNLAEGDKMSAMRHLQMAMDLSRMAKDRKAVKMLSRVLQMYQ